MEITKIAAVGAKDLILPFKAVGVEIHPVSSSQEAKKILLSLLEKGFGIILISDNFAEDVKDVFKKVSGVPLPVLLTIPGPRGSTGFTTKRIRELVKRAVGVDISR
jgi:V/A-type H+-transporting ATPase subunit F